MNLFHVHIPYVLIIGILCTIIFFQRELGGNHTTDNSHITNVYDSAQKEIPVKYISLPAQIMQVPVPSIVDTSEIIKQYFAKNIYRQTVGDSLMSAEIYASIFKNKLDSLGFKYKIKKPTAIITEVQKDKFKLFVGGQLGASGGGLKSASPAIYVLTKQDHLYTANYNLFDGSINIGGAWKIKLKK